MLAKGEGLVGSDTVDGHMPGVEITEPWRNRRAFRYVSEEKRWDRVVEERILHRVRRLRIDSRCYEIECDGDDTESEGDGSPPSLDGHERQNEKRDHREEVPRSDGISAMPSIEAGVEP